MGPEQRRRLDEVLLQAAGLETDEQAAFLASLSADDEDVATEARRRLRAADGLGDDFLASPATEFLVEACQPDEPPEETPTSNERFEILERLGRGGMASVYRAFDHQLGRVVALKFLRSLDAETPERLLREARAQARVRHDHVLDVYETGTFDDRPYIAIRHVEGGTLADFLAHEGREVSLEQRVLLVAQAASGLHAAHREGMLHGDVKPSNLFVEQTKEGPLRAWIGDFGLATELGDEGADGGPLAGTPGYVAPERWTKAAAVDRRSDVYSLGMTLFVVLTGQPPPAGTRVIDAASLHAEAPDLPPDLAAVVARCLATDPAARYPSAMAVAEDLQRFLDGEVVEAYDAHLVYRLSRWVVRHRTLLGLAAVSAVLLIAALAVATGLGFEAMRANARAEERRGQAEGLIGFMLLDLRDKLEAVGRLELLDEVGERAMRYFAAVPEAELSDIELAERSRALYQIGDVRMRGGDLEGAELAFAESLTLARGLSARRPDDDERLFDLGQSEFWSGLVLFRRGEMAAARGHFETYLEIAERLIESDPTRRDWRQELSYAYSNLGSVLQQQGDLEAALERFQGSVRIDGELVATAGDAAEARLLRSELAASHNTVGSVLEELGRLDEALVHYEADLVLRRALADEEPDNRRWQTFLGTALEYTGMLRFTLGDVGGAHDALEEAQTIFSTLVAHDPENADWRYRRALNQLHVGQLEIVRARTDETAGLKDKAATRVETALGTATQLMQASPERGAWRRLYADAALHLAALAASNPGGEREARRHLDVAIDALESPVLSGDRLAATLLADSLLFAGDLEAGDLEAGDSETSGSEPEAAEALWQRAAAVLRPFEPGSATAPDTLAVWQAVADRLGLFAESAAARQRLMAMGVRLDLIRVLLDDPISSPFTKDEPRPRQRINEP